MTKGRILLADDDKAVRSSLDDWLRSKGYEVYAVEDGAKAVEQAREHDWDLAIVDLKMPGMDGLEVLKNTRGIKPNLPIIIITGYATIDTAVVAMKEGAADYIIKPFDPDEILLVIARLIEHQRLIKENIMLRQELTRRFKFQDLVGKSRRMLEVFELIKTVAPTKSTVLVRGESGTGKELVARAIHEVSPRGAGPFVAASCGSMPESLLEAELFGYEKGAFTGAVSQHKGRIEIADKGTLFLDEIGDISPKTQADLLRFIQEREFFRLGGKMAIKVDIRIIAATNKNLEELIGQGKFREDLYYRLNVITITAPPLRERKEDLPVLIEHFLEKFRFETGKHIERISDEAMKVLIDYNWPGNVRQLENTIEHAVVIGKEPEITARDLPADLERTPLPSLTGSGTGRSLAEVEKEYIHSVLEANRWNITRSAHILKINRLTLYNKIRSYALRPSN